MSQWSNADLADPHHVADKARRVREMFGAIAPRYDLNNRLHSLGRDQAWRRAAVRIAAPRPQDVVLDVACGTGDLAMAFADRGVARVLGLDFTVGMLCQARKKNRAGAHLSYHAADAMRLSIADSCVDVVSIAFGIRNVADPAQALGEFHRVLRPEGRLLILEFDQPRNRVFRRLYQFYFNHVLPRTAALVARDRSGAYQYLPRSVHTFLDRNAMLQMIGEAGFQSPTATPLTMGIAVVYRAVKR